MTALGAAAARTAPHERVASLAAPASLALAAAYALALVSLGGEPLLVVPLAAAAVVAVVVAWPIAGLWLVLALTLLLEQFDIPGISPLTAHTRFFQNVSAYTPLPLRLSVADLLVVLTAGAALARHLRERTRPAVGPLGAAVALYLGAFAVGGVIGIARGGAWDADAALAELRGPAYLAALYLLTADLVRGGRAVRLVVWTFVACVAAKAVQGIANAVTAGASADLEAVTSHEDVVFFNAVLALAVVAVVIGMRPRPTLVLAAAASVVFAAELLTQRRVGFIGLGAVFAAILVLAMVRDARRGALLLGAAVAVACVYVPLAWDDTGTVGQPLRALRAALGDQNVTMRDQLSDHWREIEDANIAHTMRQLPLTGVGLGQEYLFQREPPVPSASFVYWRYMTHNAVLWLWLKAGPLGGFALAYLVARALLLASASFARLRPPDLRLAAALAASLVIAQVVFSSVELGLTYARTMIVLGVGLGLLAQLARASRDATAVPDRAGAA